MAGEIVDECCAVGVATRRIAERVQVQNRLVEHIERGQHLGAKCDHFHVGSRARNPKQLDPYLVELPLAALLCGRSYRNMGPE